MKELPYVFLFAPFFSLLLIFTVEATGISHFLTAVTKMFTFLLQ